MSKQLAS